MPPMPKARAHLPRHRHHGMREGTGVTGRRMLHALVAGARAPTLCATSRADRLQAREDPMATAWEGKGRPAPVCPRTPSRAL
jgi:hypothetical protein